MLKIVVGAMIRWTTAPSSMLLLLWALSAASPSFSAPLDTYLAFDTTQSAHLPDEDGIDLTGGSFTISAWIRPAGWGQNSQGRILDHGGGSSGNAGWSLLLTNSFNQGFPETLRIQINDDSSFDGLADSDAIALGVWQHVAATLDAGTLTFYVDGVVRGVRTGVPTPVARSAETRVGMRVTDTQRGFDGEIDEIRIWDRALSQAEIQAQMNITLSGSELGLVAYYPLDAAMGQTAFDFGPSGFDGFLGSSSLPENRDPTWVVAVQTNQPPTVDAGVDQDVVRPTDTAQLSGIVTDDALSGTLDLNWTTLSGPDDALFDDATRADPIATFPAEGIYTLRLTADDGEFSVHDDVQVANGPVPALTSIVVDPSNTTVVPNEARQMTASGFDQIGRSFPVSASWNASSGTIDPSGLFVAGSNLGTYHVTATDSGVNGQATVVIIPPPPNVGVWPTNGWASATPTSMGMDEPALLSARNYALSGNGSGMITRGGKVVLEWGTLSNQYGIKSSTKSIGSMILGLSIGDGLVSLDDLANQHLSDIGTPPASNHLTGWLDEMTLRQLATQAGGFDKPAGFIDQLYPPGSAWAYTDGGANWLADMLTTVHAQDLQTLFVNRILVPLGRDATNLTWRDNSNRPLLLNGIARREFGSGIDVDVDTMARLGYLMLRGGEWDGATVLPGSFVARAGRVQPEVDGLPVQNDTESRFGGASNHYGLLWWNNADGSIIDLPRDAYWSWGIKDSLIVVIPSLDIVASRAGTGFDGTSSTSFYEELGDFLEPIAQSVYIASGNDPPVVDAGPDLVPVSPVTSVALAALVSDDGNPGGSVSTTWSTFSAAGPVIFADPNDPNTSVAVGAPGIYEFDITATDGEFWARDTLIVTVPEPSFGIQILIGLLGCAVLGAFRDRRGFLRREV